jgi:hypothetical protein
MAVAALVLAYVILAGTMASQVPALIHASTRADIADFALGLLGGAAILVALHVTMRGTFRAAGAAPLEALAQLERRHAGRLRLVRAVLWIFGCVLAATVAQAVVTEGFSMLVFERLAKTEAAPVVWIVVWFVVFVRLWMRPRIDRDLREVAEARRLLGEVGDPTREGKG